MIAPAVCLSTYPSRLASLPLSVANCNQRKVTVTKIKKLSVTFNPEYSGPNRSNLDHSGPKKETRLRSAPVSIDLRALPVQLPTAYVALRRAKSSYVALRPQHIFTGIACIIGNQIFWPAVINSGTIAA